MILVRVNIAAAASSALQAAPPPPASLAAPAPHLHVGDHQVLGARLAQDLREDLDRLPAREQVRHRHARHAGHLDVVVHQHQLVEQPLREVRVLEAVDGQAPARLGRPVLQVGDDRVVHVLLLLPQEVGRDRVERVGGELVVALDGGEEIELDGGRREGGGGEFFWERGGGRG